MASVETKFTIKTDVAALKKALKKAQTKSKRLKKAFDELSREVDNISKTAAEIEIKRDNV